MREIKFRAWDKENKTMSNTMDVLEIYPYWRSVSSDDELELMQYTGLLDKNGKEIYEGDILKGGYKVEYKYDCFVVEYEKDDFASINWLSSKIGGLEIIGNIYENPDLIN